MTYPATAIGIVIELYKRDIAKFCLINLNVLLEINILYLIGFRELFNITISLTLKGQIILGTQLTPLNQFGYYSWLLGLGGPNCLFLLLPILPKPINQLRFFNSLSF